MKTTTAAVKIGDSVKVWLCHTYNDKSMYSATATAVPDDRRMYGFMLQLPNGVRFAPTVWVNGRWTRTQSSDIARRMKCSWVQIAYDYMSGKHPTPNWQNA